jgi:hypothetical protein
MSWLCMHTRASLFRPVFYQIDVSRYDTMHLYDVSLIEQFSAVGVIWGNPLTEYTQPIKEYSQRNMDRESQHTSEVGIHFTRMTNSGLDPKLQGKLSH